MSTPTTWDLTPLLASDDDPQIDIIKKEITKTTEAFTKKWQANESYLSDPATLKEALDEYCAWNEKHTWGGKLGYYVSLRKAQEQNNPTVKALYNQVHAFEVDIANKMQFFTLKLAKVDEQTQQIFLNNADLAKYKHFLERLFAEAKYLLSEAEEKIVNLYSQPAYGNWISMTSSFLAKEEREVVMPNGETEIKTFAELASLMKDTNKTTRDSAAAAFNDITQKYVDVAEHEINSVLSSKKISDDLRGIPRPDLTRHMSDDIDSEVVDALVEAVTNHKDTANKFYALKAKLLGVDKLAYHERNVPIGNLDEKKYDYDTSIELVERVFTELDPEFGSIFKGFVDQGLVDAFPRKGKASGAFCAHTAITLPTYILLNHTDKLTDVLTIAHEAGHGINNELIRKKQHALYFGTPTSTAEVASTFMEDFVLKEVKKELDDEGRLALMMTKLDQDIASIHRQVACYAFEQELHKAHREAGYLPKEAIGELFQKHMSHYMGDAVEQSAGSEHWWVYWSHIRRFFYVYSYAGGLLISKALQAGVKKDKAYVEKVKTFLAAGLSDSPKNIFLNTGIDISDKSFWNQGLAEIEALRQEAEALATKLGKI